MVYYIFILLINRPSASFLVGDKGVMPLDKIKVYFIPFKKEVLNRD